ncbi:heavy metal transporter [Microcella alkalica]|uniref:heavy metal transporter n=1 Tax=Microcella alkalica TaxID=355930 RepID=UPI00145C9276|nr:heavy metal transporter [Microcella alkalica]
MSGPDERPEPAPSPGPAPLPRVRVTAPRPGEPIAAPAEHPSIERSDTATVYVRSLIRSQLRLAIVCATGFVVSLGMLWLVLAAAPALDGVLLLGAPVSWLLLGFGAYPAILAFALIFLVASTRNEAGFRSLVSAGSDGGPETAGAAP